MSFSFRCNISPFNTIPSHEKRIILSCRFFSHKRVKLICFKHAYVRPVVLVNVGTFSDALKILCRFSSSVIFCLVGLCQGNFGHPIFLPPLCAFRRQNPRIGSHLTQGFYRIQRKDLIRCQNSLAKKIRRPFLRIIRVFPREKGLLFAFLFFCSDDTISGRCLISKPWTPKPLNTIVCKPVFFEIAVLVTNSAVVTHSTLHPLCMSILWCNPSCDIIKTDRR